MHLSHSFPRILVWKFWLNSFCLTMPLFWNQNLFIVRVLPRVITTHQPSHHNASFHHCHILVKRNKGIILESTQRIQLHRTVRTIAITWLLVGYSGNEFGGEYICLCKYPYWKRFLQEEHYTGWRFCSPAPTLRWASTNLFSARSRSMGTRKAFPRTSTSHIQIAPSPSSTPTQKQSIIS